MPFALLAGDPEVTKILIQMLLVFAAAKLLAQTAEWLRQPPVVGELIAGIVLGPGVLGWIEPNEFLTALAELGVMFLLFRVGLELKEFDLRSIGATGLAVAVGGVVLPFVAGWALMASLGHPQIEAIFVGAAMVATSVGITARVLSDKGLLEARASRIILAAAIIDDILGLLVLAVVSSMARGDINFFELGGTAAVAIGFTLLVARWGPPAMQRVVPHVGGRLRAAGGEFSLSIFLLFGLSLLALFAGVAAIIGAFLAGMALARSVSHQTHDMVGGITELLLPFFLLGIGLKVDLAVFAEASSLVLALAALLIACATKLVGCGAGAWKLGYPDALRIGAGMIPRGEVGMVVAGIGAGLGVIPPAVYAIVVFMAIGTTIAAPPLINWTFRGVELPEVEVEA
jgi:Kef-type K+ transport system membrane component KefB